VVRCVACVGVIASFSRLIPSVQVLASSRGRRSTKRASSGRASRGVLVRARFVLARAVAYMLARGSYFLPSRACVVGLTRVDRSVHVRAGGSLREGWSLSSDIQ
jgi:hypothetical protein